jgi:hypothetical protein
LLSRRMRAAVYATIATSRNAACTATGGYSTAPTVGYLRSPDRTGTHVHWTSLAVKGLPSCEP